MVKRKKINRLEVIHDDDYLRASEYGMSLAEYLKHKKKGTLPVRTLIRKYRTRESTRPGKVVSVPLENFFEEVASKSIEENNKSVHIEKKDNDFVYDLIEKEVLEAAINNWTSEQLVELWYHRLERIDKISEACELLAEVRYRQGVDEIKREPYLFYKTPQIQELLEHLHDDYSESTEEIEQKSLPSLNSSGKKKGQITQTIREGQPAFRKKLIDYYGCKCMVTGETLSDVIEAAHIHSYDGQHTNNLGNGMLLRADVHKLFDRGLIAIKPKEYVVCIADAIKGYGYDYFDGNNLILDRLPVFIQGIFDSRWEEFRRRDYHLNLKQPNRL